MKSINGRLLLLLFGGLVLAGLFAGTATYFKAREELDEVFDYQLIQVAHAFSRQESIVPLPSSGSGFEEEAEPAVQVWKGEAPVYSSTGRSVLPRQRDGFANVFSNGKHWRVFVLHSGDRVIQVSQPVEARREMSVGFALRAVIPLMLIFPALAALIWFSVRYSLKPLTGITNEIARRSPASLDPLPDRDLPTEILPLAQRLNELLGRLSNAFDAQRRFVADAAHELRTPLTALQLQLRILERSANEAERAEAVSRLKTGIDRSTRLVGQLLALARMEPEATSAFSEKISLSEMAGEIVVEQSRIAGDKGVDLGMTSDESVSIAGESDALRAMIGNLVDNAVRHTPPGGTVDVGVRRSGQSAIIEVADTGPGIPPEERERAFDRFYRRPGGDGGGSGLGLAIVKSAVERHGGVITLGEAVGGKGLRVIVELPFSRNAN
jgi:two-component system OmpR family sensor kinase